jgi:hypothetical protein
VGIAHAVRRSGIKETRILSVAAGDGISYRAKRKGCPACYDGWVYMGFEDEDLADAGETDRVPCRRCNREEV